MYSAVFHNNRTLRTVSWLTVRKKNVMSEVVQDLSQDQLKRTFYFWWNPVFMDRNFEYIYEVWSHPINWKIYFCANWKTHFEITSSRISNSSSQKLFQKCLYSGKIAKISTKTVEIKLIFALSVQLVYLWYNEQWLVKTTANQRAIFEHYI